MSWQEYSSLLSKQNGEPKESDHQLFAKRW